MKHVISHAWKKELLFLSGGPDPSSAFLTEQEFPLNSHDMIYQLGNETGLSTYLHQLPLDHRKVGEWNSRVLPQFCCCIFLLFYRVWRMDLSPWNVIIIICWTHLPDENLSQPDASARFCSTESKSLRLKTDGNTPTPAGATSTHTNFQGSSINMKNFTPHSMITPYLPWAINAITIYGICTDRGRRPHQSDHLLHNSWEKCLFGWSLYC